MIFKRKGILKTLNWEFFLTVRSNKYKAIGMRFDDKELEYIHD